MLRAYFKELIKETKDRLLPYFSFKSFILLFIIYLFAYSSLLIADVYFADDNVRRFSGKITLGGLGRIFAEVGIMLWNLSRSVLDSSPLFQLYSMLILALTSLSLLAIFEVKAGYKQLIAASFIGIFPLYYANMVYKVDAPFMAMAIFFGVMPFLFFQNKRVFIVLSFVGALLVLSTYQTALAGYFMLALVLCMDKWRNGEKINVNTLLAGSGLFILGIICYRIVIVPMVNFSHVGNQLSGAELLPGLLNNIRTFLSQLKELLGTGNLVIIGLIILLFLILFVSHSKRNKLTTALIGITGIILVFIGAGSLNLLLTNFPPNARYFLLVSLLVAMLAILVSRQKSISIAVLYTIIFMYFLNFDNGIGNALKSQNEKKKMITSQLLYDFQTIAKDQPYAGVQIIADDRGNEHNAQVFNLADDQYGSNSVHHRGLVKSLISDMDYGFANYIRLFLDKGHAADSSAAAASGEFAVVMSKSSYEILSNGKGQYQIKLKYLN